MASDSLGPVRAIACMTRLALALLCVLVLSVGEGVAQRTGSRSREAGIAMHYEDTDLTRLVDAVARETGRRFVYGDALRGRVTITVPGRVSEAEALDLLFAALYMRGFAALPLDDDTIRIVPVLETGSSAPVIADADDPRGERPITTLVSLEHISAEAAVAAMNPYLSRNSVAVAHMATNSLILAGTEGQLVRLITIARILDRSTNETLLVRTLRYRSVQLAAEMIDTVFNNTPVKANHVEIWTEERVNQLIARGHPATLDEIRRFIENFDRPVEGEGLVRVVRVLNRDAEELASLLGQLSSTAPVSAPPRGRPAGARQSGRADLASDLVGRQYHIEVDVPTQSLLISSDTQTFEVLARAISELDKLSPRVSVEVLIFEVTRPRGFKLGVNWQLLSATNQDADLIAFARSVGGASDAPTGDSVAFGRYVRAPVAITIDTPAGPVVVRPPSEDVSFEAGETLAEMNILLRPNIVGVSGEEHEVFAGDNVPIPSAQTSTVTAADGTSVVSNPLDITQNIERVDLGTRLRIKPTLGEEGIIRLEVDIEVSALSTSRVGSVEEVGPTYADRNLEATIELRPGERAVIGSTDATVSSEGRVGIPYLMDIPFLGWAFSTVQQRADQTDLIAVIEARVLRNADDTAAESIRRRLAFERAISRSADLNSVGPEPFAVLLETTNSEGDAKVIAEAFASDGFKTRITPWDAYGKPVWDVYLSDLGSFEEAGRLARRLTEAGWSPEISVLSPVNELAGD